MAESPLRAFYSKFNLAKEQLAKGNLQACLMNLSEAITIKLRGPFLKRDLTMIEEDLFNFGHKLTNHKLYVQEYGPVAMVQGHEEEWLGFINQLVSLEEEGVLGQLMYGQEQLDAGRLDLAKQAFDKIMEDHPQDAGLAMDIGDRYMDKNLYAEAEEVFRRAMEIDPNTLHILNRLAMSLRQKGELENALEIYTRAIKLNPNDEGLYYNTARVVYQMSKPELAVKLLKAALTKNPDFEAGQQFLKIIQDKMAEKKAAGRSAN
ncbi:MAG: tetratricopeptide repeat protein [Deltaproteobacteria bacterium]|nr:tetratricopeptide repeat protein [Deltaproteobacteria bacterium]